MVDGWPNFVFEMTDNCHHAWVRLVGYDLAIVPAQAFVAWAENGPAARVDIGLSSGAFAQIIPHEGGYKSKLDLTTTSSVYDVAQIELLTAPARWAVQTSIYRCDWPAGGKLRSIVAPSAPWPFDFFTENGLLIWVQNPRQIPVLQDMAAPGQSLIEMNERNSAPSVLLSYLVQSQPWHTAAFDH